MQFNLSQNYGETNSANSTGVVIRRIYRRGARAHNVMMCAEDVQRQQLPMDVETKQSEDCALANSVRAFFSFRISSRLGVRFFFSRLDARDKYF